MESVKPGNHSGDTRREYTSGKRVYTVHSGDLWRYSRTFVVAA